VALRTIIIFSPCKPVKIVVSKPFIILILGAFFKLMKYGFSFKLLPSTWFVAVSCQAIYARILQLLTTEKDGKLHKARE
jgi:hypothetical protein